MLLLHDGPTKTPKLSLSYLSPKALASCEDLHDGVQLEINHGHGMGQGPALNEEASTSRVNLDARDIALAR